MDYYEMKKKASIDIQSMYAKGTEEKEIIKVILVRYGLGSGATKKLIQDLDLHT